MSFSTSVCVFVLTWISTLSQEVCVRAGELVSGEHGDSFGTPRCLNDGRREVEVAVTPGFCHLASPGSERAATSLGSRHLYGSRAQAHVCGFRARRCHTPGGVCPACESAHRLELYFRWPVSICVSCLFSEGPRERRNFRAASP